MQSISTRKVFVNGKKVGEVVGDTFYKEIRGSKHIMRSPHAIFFDVQSLREVESYGAKNITVTDKETGDIYTATMSLVWQKAIYKNYGYGEQVGLAVDSFTVTHGQTDTHAQAYTEPTVTPLQYEKTHHTVAEKQVGQLPLFGGIR